MLRGRVVPILGAALLVGASALAQEPPPGPPPVLVISHEEIKPGSMGPHEKQVTAYLALFERAKVGNYRLGLVPISGDNNHILYLEGYPSFAEVEATNNKLEETLAANPAWQAEFDQLNRQTDPMHTLQTTAIAVYRPDLSYRPHKMDEVAKMRFFTAITNRIKPGRTADYIQYVKQLNQAREKAQIADVHTAVYQVTSGAPAGTFITFAVNRSLAEQDQFRAGMEARNKATDEALGGETAVKQRSQMAEQIFADSVSVLYSVNRKISRPSPQFVAADPDFWSPKAPAKALAAKKEQKK